MSREGPLFFKKIKNVSKKCMKNKNKI